MPFSLATLISGGKSKLPGSTEAGSGDEGGASSLNRAKPKSGKSLLARLGSSKLSAKFGRSSSELVGSGETAPITVETVAVETPTPPAPPPGAELSAWLQSACALDEIACAQYADGFVDAGCTTVQGLEALGEDEWPEAIDTTHRLCIRDAVLARADAADAPAQPPEEPRARRKGSDKFRPDIPTFVFGKAEVYRAGILARVAPSGLARSVLEEFEENESSRWLNELQYVTEQPSVEAYPSTKGRAPDAKQIAAYTRDLGHEGWTLNDYFDAQPAEGDGHDQISERLSRAEIVVLRMYTGPWFQSINFYLRYLPSALCCDEQPYHAHYDARRCYLDDPQNPGVCRHARCMRPKAEHHEQALDSWATSAALLCNGIVKLKEASGPGTVYRGVREEFIQLPESFVTAADGEFAHGVELAPMSTSYDKEVSLSYAGEGAGSLFEISFNSQQRGAKVKFLSQYPAEVCHARLTCRALPHMSGSATRVHAPRLTLPPNGLRCAGGARLPSWDEPRLREGPLSWGAEAHARAPALDQPRPQAPGRRRVDLHPL